MVHRGLATLSGALMVCFLLLSHYDPEFFLLHFYQSLIFLAIILMLFYFQERWAYMLGMLAPAVWLLLSFATGLLGGAVRQVSRLMLAQRPTNPVTLIAGLTAALAIALIAMSFIRWKREFTGLGKGWSTFLVSFFIVALYYAVLIAWFWRQIPQGPSG
jgi:hypothetical protein